LQDGRWMAFGRGQPIEGRMPISISRDQGETWEYFPSEFPRIGGGQRLVFMRLREGPLLFVSFTEPSATEGQEPTQGMEFADANGNRFVGYGMFAALSYDEGETWPARKLLTPGEGRFDGQAWTGEFEATPTRAEHGGYLAATQTPDNVIHLVSSGLHYRFNKKWIETPASARETQ
jgi:formylglycine-generating enzyme